MSGYYLNLIFAGLIIEAVEDAITRTPDYWIFGRDEMSLTLANLSPIEMKKILPILEGELPGGFISKIRKIRSTKEKDNPNFIFSQPGYVEGEKERVSERQFNQQYKNHLINSLNTIAQSDGYKDPESEETPLTIKALARYSHYSEISEMIQSKNNLRTERSPQYIAMIVEDPEFFDKLDESKNYLREYRRTHRQPRTRVQLREHIELREHIPPRYDQ